MSFEKDDLSPRFRFSALRRGDAATSRTFSEVTEAQVGRCLHAIHDMRTYPRGERRDFLASILSAVEHDRAESTVRPS